MHIAIVSSEIAPFARTGGLGDVLGSLPQALEKLGLRISLIMPAYRHVLNGHFALEDTHIHFSIPIGDRLEEVFLWKTRIGSNIPVFLIRADQYFDRDYLYGTPDGDYIDNAERFAFFSRAVLEVLRLDPPQILHANDWQSALSVGFLKIQPRLYRELADTKTIFTIHNLGYQGIYSSLAWPLLNLEQRFFNYRYLEFHGKINYLKAGVAFADYITTVSPSYAEEIKTTDQGFGLDGALKERAENLVGILNGADYEVWNPKTDPLIAKNYDTEEFTGKKVCKSDLQRIFNVPQDSDIPLIGMVSRLSSQKGFDLLEAALAQLMSRQLQLVILGTGDRHYQDYLSQAQVKYPGRLGVRITFDDTLAHNVFAGADISLIPSRYEPCGLTQFYSLKYGTVPVVRATGGLKDSIVDFDTDNSQGNGLVFAPYSAKELLETVDRGLNLYRNKQKWQKLMVNGMTADFSWERSAKIYRDLYHQLIAV